MGTKSDSLPMEHKENMVGKSSIKILLLVAVQIILIQEYCTEDPQKYLL
ncbi:MAG: hypothetical protein Greene041614_361 [Parcubacteria group bacterium Greene0416_14]|nr:MAG: hypothetical protein Greene041614_361 [Parcubacteria group bacterium Greene0416_14]TSD01329.1 MAG: hypothetical protein Greene101415_343 [Parcubacteria group bacterium Greene1014_15]TSD08017.1 MAG: hypothetical protein Greene07144_505 [Parcubacteria group bacterium Greene0714_4]